MTPKQGVFLVVSIGIASVFILSACATVGEKLAPVANPPTLTGTWKGEWGGNMQHPIELFVEKQDGAVVSGTMTFIADRTSTHRMTGRIGAKQDGTVWVVMDVEGRDFPLKVVSEKRLEGTGTSHMHQGPAILTRQ
jgi:hypothetical protein